MKPLKLKGDGKIEVTIHYVSDETLVQEDEVGNTYVFKKMSDSYPVPYALWLLSAWRQCAQLQPFYQHITYIYIIYITHVTEESSKANLQGTCQ